MEKNAFVIKTTTEWKTSPRWTGITRPYTADDVFRLRGSYDIEYSVAKLGAERLWSGYMCMELLLSAATCQPLA